MAYKYCIICAVKEQVMLRGRSCYRLCLVYLFHGPHTSILLVSLLQVETKKKPCDCIGFEREVLEKFGEITCDRLVMKIELQASRAPH